MLNQAQIENNTKWLLANASLPVRYLTHRDILDSNSTILSKLFTQVEKSDIVKEIYSKQEKDGSWCSPGSWAAKPIMRKSGYTPVSPKYVTSSWILPLLGNMGYSIKDERILKACEYVFTYQRDNGYIGEVKPTELNKGIEGLIKEPCRFSIILIALAKVGAAHDPRVKKAFDLLISWQNDDGGWVSESHSNQKKWIRSCPFVTYHAAMALYSLGDSSYKKQLKNAMEFLINHLSQKQDTEIQRFFYHGHSIIHELLIFSEHSVGLDTKLMDKLLNWLLSMYQTNKSSFKYIGKSISKYNFKEDYMDSKVAKYRMFHLIEEDWLTYYATRIFKNLLDKATLINSKSSS